MKAPEGSSLRPSVSQSRLTIMQASSRPTLLTAESETLVRKSRLVGIRLAMLTLRLRENWIRLFGDQETALIVLGIVVISSERLMRTDIDDELENLMVPFPVEQLASCNISSIAAATGFNRETTRRKVEQLAKAGFIIRDGNVIRLAPGLVQQELVLEVVQSQLAEVRRAVNDLLRMEAVDIEVS